MLCKKLLRQDKGVSLIGVVLVLILVLALGFAGLMLGLVLGVGRSAAPADTSPSPPAAVAAGGELRLLGADPPTLDPHLSSDTDSATYVVEIYSGLLTLNPSLEVIPDIAERWEASSDQLTYTFYLRRGVKFHNGREVTARDFKYSFERATDPRTESTTADAYLGDIIGVKDKLRGRAQEVKGVKVVDDYTLQITIDAPKVYFLAKMTYPASFVVDRENVESSRRWTDNPNGTGPFRLKEWRKGERIVLERNPHFYRGVAKLERVRFILAGGSSMTMYENNEIDVAGIGLDDLERARDPSNPLSKELISGAELSIGYIGFNVTQAPFDDVKVRQAFAHAIDKDKIVSVVLKDLVKRADGILPPGLPGYNPKLKGLGFDPAKAKQLLVASKYGDPTKFPRVTLTIPGTGAQVPSSAEAIIAMWKANLGIAIEIQQVEWATFLQDLKRHRFQLYDAGWVADYADPQDFLDLLFHTESQENNMLYSNPELDRLVEKARVEPDRAKRLSYYQEAEEIIVKDAPWIPLWFGQGYLLVKPYVNNYRIMPMVIPMLKDVSLEKR